jgi:GTPase SAR1 family protein
MVFDVNQRDTFDNLSRWIQWMQDNGSPSTQFLLIGTKIDAGSRQVTPDEALAFAQAGGAFSYIEVSGKTGDNVHEIVDQIGAFVCPLARAGDIELHVREQRSC